jgi:hypothetical protein
VYDVEGRLVTTLENRIFDPGRWRSHWNGRDAAGNLTASGIYFYRVHAGGRVLTRKLLFLK